MGRQWGRQLGEHVIGEVVGEDVGGRWWVDQAGWPLLLSPHTFPHVACLSSHLTPHGHLPTTSVTPLFPPAAMAPPLHPQFTALGPMTPFSCLPHPLIHSLCLPVLTLALLQEVLPSLQPGPYSTTSPSLVPSVGPGQRQQRCTQQLQFWPHPWDRAVARPGATRVAYPHAAS